MILTGKGRKVDHWGKVDGRKDNVISSNIAVRRIDSEFAEVEAYYDGEGAGNLLESPDENV